ncbi:MAG: TetR/AcrR family transcriptional regulator [Chitinophagales bacterium]|nr:TetR/AcrR family transcriptional regulator [Chitinophagales bacterium]
MNTNETEILIKETARKIFHEKGFAATKTRDIAKAANINLALVNYYFRSKKKLYDIIMLESIQHILNGVLPILNDKHTSIEEKLEQFVIHYTDLLIENPDVPTFILNEIRQNPEELIKKIGVFKQIKKSYLLEQFKQEVNYKINPIHIGINTMAFIAFPFIAMPLIKNVFQLPDVQYNSILKERKKLIPIWLKSISYNE